MNLTLASRDSLFLRNLFFASYLCHWQTAILKDHIRLFEVGEKVYLENDEDEPTTLSEDQARRLNQEIAEDNAARCDDIDAHLPKLKYFGEVIAEFPASETDDFARELGEKTMALVTEMGWDEVFVMPRWIAPFLDQENDYPAVKSATDQLMKMGLTSEYSGGIVLNARTAEAFFRNIFWIVRCNASAPDIVFTGVNSSVFGLLCKYGNIHFECCDAEEKQELLKSISSVGLNAVQGRTCEPAGAIEGRKLDLG